MMSIEVKFENEFCGVFCWIHNPASFLTVHGLIKRSTFDDFWGPRSFRSALHGPNKVPVYDHLRWSTQNPTGPLVDELGRVGFNIGNNEKSDPIIPVHLWAIMVGTPWRLSASHIRTTFSCGDDSDILLDWIAITFNDTNRNSTNRTYFRLA